MPGKAMPRYPKTMSREPKMPAPRKDTRQPARQGTR